MPAQAGMTIIVLILVDLCCKCLIMMEFGRKNAFNYSKI
jgi:hypothetical protein